MHLLIGPLLVTPTGLACRLIVSCLPLLILATEGSGDLRRSCSHRVLSEEGAAATREAGSHLITALCRSAQTEKALAVYEDMVLANRPVATASQLQPQPQAPLTPTRPPQTAEATPSLQSLRFVALLEFCSMISRGFGECCMYLALMISH